MSIKSDLFTALYGTLVSLPSTILVGLLIVSATESFTLNCVISCDRAEFLHRCIQILPSGGPPADVTGLSLTADGCRVEWTAM